MPKLTQYAQFHRLSGKKGLLVIGGDNVVDLDEPSGAVEAIQTIILHCSRPPRVDVKEFGSAVRVT